MADNIIDKIPSENTSPDSDAQLYFVTDPGGTPADDRGSAENVITKAHGLSDGLLKVNTGVIVSTADADDVDDTSTTNKFTTASDISKLAGIETSADVTDATNVDAAGATMNSDTTLSGNGYFLDEDTMSSDSATKVPSQQSVKAYVDTELGDLPVLGAGTRVTLDTITTPGTMYINTDTSIGLSGGSTIAGGVGSGQSLTLSSTNHATKGTIIMGTSAYDEANNRLGIGNATPTVPLDVTGAIVGSTSITGATGIFSTSTTTPLLYGSTSSAGNATIESTSHGTKGRILMSDQLTMLDVGRTFTATPGTFILFPSTTTHTIDFTTGTMTNVLGFLSTVEFNQTTAAIPGTLFNNNMTAKNTAGSGNMTLGIISSFIVQFHTQADTATVTYTGNNDFWSRPRYSVTNGGTLNVGNINQFLAGANSSGIGTGAAVTNRRGLSVLDFTGGSGTLTNNYGIEVASQVRGTAINYGIKVDLPSGATVNQAITLTDATGVTAGGIGFRGTSLQLYSGTSSTLDTNANFQTTGTAANSSSGGSGAVWRQNSGVALGSGHRLGFNLFAGYDGGAVRNAAGFNVYADSAWSSGVYPVYINIETSDGSGARAERVRFGGAAGVTAKFAAGTIEYVDNNFIFGTSTGSKFGTATSQKISFWNKTPIIQPTTGITAAAFVANTSGTVNDTATFGGYTIGKIAAALINVGILA